MKKIFILAIIIVFLSTACSWQKKPESEKIKDNNNSEKQAELVYSSFENDIVLATDNNFEIVKIIPNTGSLGNDYSAYRYKWEDNNLYIKFVSIINVCEEIIKIEENLQANNINYAVYQSNNQEQSDNYCNGISQYLIEFKLNNIERKDYNFIDTIGKSNRVIRADIESTYNKESDKVNTENSTIKGNNNPVIIYKTTDEYYNLVPVFLSEDKSKIVSYPTREDLYRNDFLTYPNKMSKNYIYDNFGIDENVAFLKISYEDYSQLSENLNAEELYEKIIDKDPILEMYDCQNLEISDDIIELNKLVKKEELNKCEKIK